MNHEIKTNRRSFGDAVFILIGRKANGGGAIKVSTIPARTILTQVIDGEQRSDVTSVPVTFYPRVQSQLVSFDPRVHVAIPAGYANSRCERFPHMSQSMDGGDQAAEVLRSRLARKSL